MRKSYSTATTAWESKEYEAARAGFPEAWSLYRPNGRALWSAGLVTKETGDAAGAQRLFDRALVELEEVAGKMVVPYLPIGSLDGTLAVAWSRDGRWLPIATGTFVSIRDQALNLRETAQLAGTPTRSPLSRSRPMERPLPRAPTTRPCASGPSRQARR
ncbi:hypothetical protein WMF44_34920 [Sorangium sp. So ce426]